MKTIAYKDLAGGGLKMFYKHDDSLLRQTRLERIVEGLTELNHTGNIAIYLIDSNKTRLLRVKHW